MDRTLEKLRELRRRENEVLGMGGVEAVRKHQEKGKLTARERLFHLFDPGTFQELDALVRHRAVHFGMEKVAIPADGVITGHGLVDGRPVFAYAQDFTARGGSLGEMHAKKIVKVQDLALRAGAPIVGMNDSGGARIQEGVDALAGFGEIFTRNADASGVIPQICAVMGPTAGGAVYSPGMMDWVFMVKNSSYMFITGPDVIRSVTGEAIDFESLGGAMTHAAKSGVAHFAVNSDLAAIEGIRELLSYLPANNMEDPPMVDLGDDPFRVEPDLDHLIPASPQESYDIHKLISLVADSGKIFETHALFAKNIVTALIRMNGRTVGVIANQPAVMAGCLDIDASDKASRFIRFCDAFNIPLLTFSDVPGFLPGSAQEWNGIIRHGAKLLWSYVEATVPKLLVITRKAYGGAYIAMSSKHLGADMVFAWPTAEIAVMGAEGAINIIHRKEISDSLNPERTRLEKVEEYERLFSNPYMAAERGYVDAVIQPSETRQRVIGALEALSGKRVQKPAKKHGNIPL